MLETALKLNSSLSSHPSFAMRCWKQPEALHRHRKLEMDQHMYVCLSFKNGRLITRAKICVFLVCLSLAIFSWMAEGSTRKFGSLKTKCALTVSISIQINSVAWVYFTMATWSSQQFKNTLLSVFPWTVWAYNAWKALTLLCILILRSSAPAMKSSTHLSTFHYTVTFLWSVGW